MDGSTVASLSMDSLGSMMESASLLLDQQQYDEADNLASLAIACASGSLGDVAADETFNLLLIRVEALSHKGEHKRALHFGRQAQVMQLKPATSSSTRSQGGASGRGILGSGPVSTTVTPATPLASRAGAQLANQGTPLAKPSTGNHGVQCPPGLGTGTLPRDLQMRLRVADCCIKLNDFRGALTELDAIPNKQRTLRVNALLGQLNIQLGHPRAATLCLQDCLRQCPCFLGAFSKLVSLGASIRGIAEHLPSDSPAHEPVSKGTRAAYSATQNQPPQEVGASFKWLLKYAEFCAAKLANKYQTAADRLRSLARMVGIPTLPSFLLVELARLEAAQGRYEEAMAALTKARSQDPFMVEGSDDMALLLFLHGIPSPKASHPASRPLAATSSEEAVTFLDHLGIPPVDREALDRLAGEVLALAPQSNEGLFVTALFWIARGEQEKALGYLEEASSPVSSSLGEGAGAASRKMLLQGWLTLQGEQPDSIDAARVAMPFFRRACLARPELRAYQGLARACLRCGHFKDGLAAARDVVRAFPESSSAQALLGEVYMFLDETQDKARKALEAALKLRPVSLSAVVTLASWHVKQSRRNKAIDLLQEHLEERKGAPNSGAAQALLHSQLGLIHMQLKNFMEAHAHFQAALRLNPKSAHSTYGVQKLEELLKARSGGNDEEDQEETAPISLSPFLL